MKIIIVGKIRNKNLQNEIEGLKKRISRLEIIQLKEIKDKNVEIIKKKEFELIKSQIKHSNHNFLLIQNGIQFSTKAFYGKLKNQSNELVFILTGPYGPNENLKTLIPNHLSLSKMTFTHEQALYLLIEQLYRVECYKKNIPYTK